MDYHYGGAELFTVVKARYKGLATRKIYGGDTLMNLGIFQNCDHDQTSVMRVFKKI